MAKYWTASMQYSQMSVEELQRKAQESVKNAKNKGKEMHPIIVEERQIAKSWWGMAWCKNIEQYADYASRIERGKRYVRSGAVVDLQIVKGKVKARVQGTRKTPYKVEINISPLKEEVCEILGFPEDWLDEITVTGISLNYDPECDELRGMVVTMRKDIENLNCPLNINTPFIKFANYCDNYVQFPVEESQWSYETLDLINDIIKDTFMYMCGDTRTRQRDMFE